MCIHNNEEDIDCAKCCFDSGYEDALEGECDPPYKNFWQVEEYYDGWKKGLTGLNFFVNDKDENK